MEVSNGALHIYWHDASKGFELWELPSDSNIHALGLSFEKTREELDFEEGTFSFSTQSPVMVRIPKLKEAFDECSGNIHEDFAIEKTLELERPFCCLEPRIQSAILCSFVRTWDADIKVAQIMLADRTVVTFKVTKENGVWQLI